MRLVGDLKGKKLAERLVNYLIKEKIDARWREEQDEFYSIWVINEDDLGKAENYFESFKISPDSSKFDASRDSKISFGVGEESSTAWNQKNSGRRGRYIDVRTEIFNRNSQRKMPVTIFLIVVSVVATIASGIPAISGIMRSFYFSEYFTRDFPEILHGQVWRLVTPIFLHGGIWHLLFNMMWIYQLGGAIENEEGSVYLAIFTTVIACLVNTAEYLASGPLFIGMSGVVYAMLGYIWIMSHYQTSTRYALAPGTILMMVVWLVICLLGIIPSIANAQHVVGLLLGGIWGLLRSKYLITLVRQRRRGD